MKFQRHMQTNNWIDCHFYSFILPRSLHFRIRFYQRRTWPLTRMTSRSRFVLYTQRIFTETRRFRWLMQGNRPIITASASRRDLSLTQSVFNNYHLAVDRNSNLFWKFHSTREKDGKSFFKIKLLFYLKHETDKNSFASISCFAIVGARFTARDFSVAAQSSSCKFNCTREINRNKLESVLKQNVKKVNKEAENFMFLMHLD